MNHRPPASGHTSRRSRPAGLRPTPAPRVLSDRSSQPRPTPPARVAWPAAPDRSAPLPAGRASLRVVEPTTRESIDTERYSRLAGQLTDPPADRPYRVSYRSLGRKHGQPFRPLVYAVGNVAFEAFFVYWLLLPSHRALAPENRIALAASIFVLATVAVMEAMRLINVVSLSVASVVARDPIPVTAPPGLRVAFCTTIVPGSEPFSTVRDTLVAAREIRYDGGGVDVWLLDEGDDDAVRAACASLGVHHFSRKGIARYNQPTGPCRAKTKHGNYNAWLDSHGDDYDVLMSVDPDHVPVPNYAERILGYFRDPDVAYVVGPQDYGNCADSFITMAAESQQFPFHSVIQRAANFYSAAMLVGTNNAMRVAALRAVGGLQDSITEDMATGLALHSRRNPETGRRWKSVYTPDVLAVGEGPSDWGSYFSQQDRWSRGTFEVLLKDFWRRAPRLRPVQLLHYGLITTFYPSMALGWLLGAVNALLYAVLGVRGIIVPPQVWLMLYVDATLFQLWLYIFNRRYNVSPFEAEGSFGLAGMVMSVLASPIFAGAFMKAVFRRSTKFVVTPKGASGSADSLFTFRRHFAWAALFALALAISFHTGYATPAASVWPALALVICLLPAGIWRYEQHSKAHPVQTERNFTVLKGSVAEEVS